MKRELREHIYIYRKSQLRVRSFRSLNYMENLKCHDKRVHSLRSLNNIIIIPTHSQGMGGWYGNINMYIHSSESDPRLRDGGPEIRGSPDPRE